MHSNTTDSSRAGGVGTTLSLALLAILLIAVAAFFCFKLLQPRIERDLNTRVAAALQGTGASDFSIDGQSVVLTGEIGSDIASKRAEESAQSVYGVSRVINKLTVNGSTPDLASDVETAGITADSNTEQQQNSESEPLVPESTVSDVTSPATLTIASIGDKISTTGILPDTDTIERITTALSGKFGRGNVNDELSSFEGSDKPLWLEGMLSMIDQLDGINNPVLKVTGTDLVLGGSVTAEDIRRAKLATAERLLGSDLKVIDNLTVVPVEVEEENVDTEETEVDDTAIAATPASNPASDPVTAITPPSTPDPVPDEATAPVAEEKRTASIEIRSSNNQISLTGFVASEADASALRTGLNDIFGANGFDDELTISDSVANATWIDDALNVTSEVQNIEDFGINIRSDQMRLSGNVADRETGRDLAITATEIAGDKLGVLNNFSVNNVVITDSNEDLMAESLLQELDALPTSSIRFNRNSATLTENAKEVLEDVAAAILGYSDLVVEIAGHTDTTGDAVRNLSLSQQRAAAVRDYLVEINVPANRLSPIGYGETTPIRDNGTSAGRAANRRIEFNL